MRAQMARACITAEVPAERAKIVLFCEILKDLCRLNNIKLKTETTLPSFSCFFMN
jgi:hypothetical protein